LHNLDTPQADDQLIYEQPDAKELSFTPFITHDGKYLFLDVWHGSDAKNRFYYREVASEEPFIRLLDEADAGYLFYWQQWPHLLLPYHPGCPSWPHHRHRHPPAATRQRQELVSQQEDVIAFALMVNQQFVVAYMHNAYHRIMLYTPDGTFVREIPLPTLGSIIEVAGKPDQTELFISFTSFLYPPGVYRYDFSNATLSPLYTAQLTFDANTYETKQAFYASKDGTRVPMS